ncbi:hypothetical protein BCR39DRAFT_511584 [Naematelia encephala]|uniref:Phospholipase/carboxylesterase/thioesterase domain-containing protein n=1 Tax=Naematelia encephala TaxID=71784 RepID=A0A1Y2BM04_9TREE|nr:hypothetical protein BCR39DRAFT_511584 [Naematelia encephala]
MTELNLRPVASSSSSTSSSSKPIPTSSLLKPWDFTYSPSQTGKDLNLLIMFHGLGDTKLPFSNLGRQLNLPHTAVLSLQAPNPIPLLENPSYSWYNTFTPLFEPLASPDPTTALPSLRHLLEALTSSQVGWELPQIHLFGWGQGGTMSLELAYNIGREPLDTCTTGAPAKRFGSVISICAPLLSHPTSDLKLETPVLYFTRQSPQSAVGKKNQGVIKRAFKQVDVVVGKDGKGEEMPRGRGEWEGIMRFWAQVLKKDDDGWKGGGQVFEVVR